jgi:hypothetical protein
MTTTWNLYYLRRKTPVMRIVPDEKYDGMWRIHWPDGKISDMVNLSRARDAAVMSRFAAEIHSDRQRFHWKAAW